MTGTIELIEEPYLSVQGEGKHIGVPMVFLRTAICPVGCHWCDSRYTWMRGTLWEFEELKRKVRAFNCPNLWVTGGEPLIRARELTEFIHFTRPDFRWFICTSGSYWNDEVKSLLSSLDHICLDFKLKSAETKIPTNRKLVDFLLNEKRDSSEFKCVIENHDDWQEVKRLADLTYPDVSLTIQPMYEACTDATTDLSHHESYEFLSPEDKIVNQSPMIGYRELAESFLRELHTYPQVRFLPQWQKIIWPLEMKGV